MNNPSVAEWRNGGMLGPYRSEDQNLVLGAMIGAMIFLFLFVCLFAIKLVFF